MNPQAKKRLLIVGGVVALGGVAYYLWSKSQEAAAPPLPVTGGGGGALPQKTTTTTKAGPSPGQIQAYKDAVANLDKWIAYVAANRPTNQAELDAMTAKTEEFKQAVRDTAAVIGVSPGV
jgi:hypothetical protein